MKAFIVSALLVAAVAGQSMDMYKSVNNRDLQIASRKGLTFNKLRDFYGGDYSNKINNFDGDYYFPGSYDQQDTYMNVLQYDEIVALPLFREYMSLPFFRQYWSYPMFQRYVCSHYFQRYWTMPAFQQYFVEPTLFYKYIYPIVQLYKYDSSTTYNTYSGGEWFWNRNAYPMGDYYQGQQQLTNGLPTVCMYNSVYCRNLIQKLYNHMMYNSLVVPETSMDMGADYYKYNPYYSRMMYPAVYNKDYYPSVYNREFYPGMYNKEIYPTVYNKEFQNFEVPSTKTTIDQDVLRQMLTNSIARDANTKPVVAEKTFEPKNVIVPEQLIKA